MNTRGQGIHRRRFIRQAAAGWTGAASLLSAQEQEGEAKADAAEAAETPAPAPPPAPAPGIELRFLCWEGAMDQALADQFIAKIEAERGIKIAIKFEFADHSDQFFRSAMLRSYDLVTPSQEDLKAGRYRYINRQLAIPIRLQNVPNFERLNRCLKHLNTAWQDGALMAMPQLSGPLGLAYRVFLDEEPPLSWKALWESKYRNRLSVSRDDAIGNVFIAALAAGLGPHEFSNVALLQEKVPDLLMMLALNARTLWEGVDTVEDLEECYIATSWGDSLPGLAKKDQIWQLANPEEGTLGWVDLWMMTKRVLRPGRQELVEAWLDFYLSPEVQLNRLRATRNHPVIEGLDDEPDIKTEEILQFRLSDPEYFVNSFIVYPSLNERTDRAIQDMWKTALEDSGKG